MRRGRISKRLVRAVVGVAVAFVLLASVGVIGYRVFEPRESLTRPTTPYPAVMMITDERPFSELRAAPLVVDGRLRVYAEKRRVWADAPVGDRYEATPYWAFRRWPQQVVGVAAVSTPDGPLVISQWSDGELITLNARLGEIAWRTTAPVGVHSYQGRRTGASVVYEPHSLRTVRVGGASVLVVTGPGVVAAYAAETGVQLWQHSVAGGCEPAVWTGASLVVLPACGGIRLSFLSATTGDRRGTWTPPEHRGAGPALCELGRNECRLVTQVDPDGSSKAWLLRRGGTLDRVPAIEPGAVLAGDRVILQTDDGVVARRLTDSAALWTYTGIGRLIGADTVGVYLLTDDRTVLGLSPVSGHLSVLGCASSEVDEDWRIGHIHTTGGSYLAMERITDQPETSPDRRYYYGPRPVALVELYPPNKLPVWPGKFAACVRRG